MTDELIGKSLDRYHIIEKLGEGGMAAVYKAFDTRLERQVAIKVILHGWQGKPQFLRRFEREAKALAQLSHPNIVKVHDYGEADGKPYLVMEYLPSGTLKEKMGRRLSPAEAAHLLLPVGRALAYAHQRGIIHRDIKPANILLTASGDPMLTDFGIARMLGGDQTQLTASGVGIGTPEYMAPEQGLAKKVDQRADLYALGVVFYELLTGRRPYQADTPMAVMLKKTTEPLPPPRQFVPDIPEEVEQVIFSALARDPENRYPDMERFNQALQALTAQYTPPAVARTAEFIAPRHPKRKLPLPLIVGIALLGLIVIVGGAVWAAGKLFLPQEPAQTQAAEAAQAEVVEPTAVKPAPTTAPGEPTQASASPTTAPSEPSALSGAAVISAQNLDSVVELEHWGKGSVEQFSLSADGRTLAVVTPLGVHIYTTDPLQETAFLDTTYNDGAAFSPDGSLLATWDNSTVQVWQVEGAGLLQTLSYDFTGSNSVTTAVFSADNTWLAAAGFDTVVRGWQVESGEFRLALTGHSNPAFSLAFSPDGSLLASADKTWHPYGETDNTLRIWDTSDGTQLQTLDYPGALAFSPDGSLLAVTNGENLRLIKTDNWKLRPVASVDQEVLALKPVFSPDGSLLAAIMKNDSIQLWPVNEGDLPEALPSAMNTGSAMAFAADGGELLSIGDDNTLRRWDTGSGQPLGEASLSGFGGEISALAVSPDGSLLAADCGTDVCLWQVQDGSLLYSLEGHTNPLKALAFAPDGGVLYSIDQKDAAIRVWQTESGSLLNAFKLKSGYFQAFALAPDGSRMAVAQGLGKKQVVVLKSNGEEEYLLEDLSEDVTTLVFSPDSTQLAAGTEDGTVTFWQADDGSLQYSSQGHAKSVSGLVYTPDGNLLVSAAEDEQVILWQSSDGQQVSAFEVNGKPAAPAVSPDGSLLALALGSRVELWQLDSDTPQLLGELSGHADSVNSVVFSPDGSLLITAGEDGTTRFWGIQP